MDLSNQFGSRIEGPPAEPIGKSNPYRRQSLEDCETSFPSRKAFTAVLCSTFNDDIVSSSNINHAIGAKQTS